MKFRNINRKIYMVSFNAPLNKDDTDKQTYGCRTSNPDICQFYCASEECAFVNKTHICTRPSKRWQNQYKKLKDVT